MGFSLEPGEWKALDPEEGRERQEGLGTVPTPPPKELERGAEALTTPSPEYLCSLLGSHLPRRHPFLSPFAAISYLLWKVSLGWIQADFSPE